MAWEVGAGGWPVLPCQDGDQLQQGGQWVATGCWRRGRSPGGESFPPEYPAETNLPNNYSKLGRQGICEAARKHDYLSTYCGIVTCAGAKGEGKCVFHVTWSGHVGYRYI